MNERMRKGRKRKRGKNKGMRKDSTEASVWEDSPRTFSSFLHPTLGVSPGLGQRKGQKLDMGLPISSHPPVMRRVVPSVRRQQELAPGPGVPGQHGSRDPESYVTRAPYSRGTLGHPLYQQQQGQQQLLFYLVWTLFPHYISFNSQSSVYIKDYPQFCW